MLVPFFLFIGILFEYLFKSKTMLYAVADFVTAQVSLACEGLFYHHTMPFLLLYYAILKKWCRSELTTHIRAGGHEVGHKCIDKNAFLDNSCDERFL